ncbi:BfmA/BtgA family mobilization protein [Mariniflexile fucanivorans]|uniref:BfmA/BtgA family mobilization protein n=2 Tax=Mariniflexile fucanivorans TaxID=264023 RepID=UPI00104577F3|nr:BfmA/BtgA family mobilization protein [Mariniflexile fucanivorans]
MQQNAVKPLKTGIYLQQKMTEYSKYSFSGINVKKEVAIKFRKFSRQISVSHTHALEAMLHFFERNDLSPDGDP